MRNASNFRELPVNAPFCNRKSELKELHAHAKNKTNVVLISPRRYGKTSLVKRVQDRLRKEHVVTICNSHVFLFLCGKQKEDKEDAGRYF